MEPIPVPEDVPSDLGNDGEMLIQPAACLNQPDEIENAQRLTGAGVLELAGHRRCGPVEWRHFHGADTCREMLHGLFAGDERPIVGPSLDQFDAFFAEYPDDCVLVVAGCPVTERHDT